MWRLRSRLFEHIIHQEVGFFDRVRTGELMNRLSEVRALDACTSVFVVQDLLPHQMVCADPHPLQGIMGAFCMPDTYPILLVLHGLPSLGTCSSKESGSEMQSVRALAHHQWPQSCIGGSESPKDQSSQVRVEGLLLALRLRRHGV